MSTILTKAEGFTPVIDVLAQELGLMTAVVYGIVWRYCQMENKVCSASRETIAEHANISIKTVDRHLDKLCEAGYLKDLHPDWKHRPHIYADTGKLKIEALVKVKRGETESPTTEEGGTESLTDETQSPTSGTESLTGETESPTKIPSYDSSHDSSLGKEDSDFSIFPEKSEPASPASPDPGGGDPVDAPDFADGLDAYWQHQRITEEVQAEAGGNHAVSVQAGGSFALGDCLITSACARLGRSEPQGDKRKNARAFFEEALKAEGLLQGDEDMLERAVKDWLDPEGDYAFYLPQYDLNPKHELALRHFGIVLSKAKKQAAKPNRRARDVEAMEASLAALEERQAARSPPAEDDKWGTAVKGELQLQMTKATFDTWVKPAGMVCDDGVFVVTVANAFARDWLENRLLTTIERTLVGIIGHSVKVEILTTERIIKNE